MEADTAASGWEIVNLAVASAMAEVAAAAPNAATAVEGNAYVMRVLTSCLNDAFLGHLLTESGLTRVLPTRGGPNPDYHMARAGLDPSQRYRLEGKFNASERIGVGVYGSGVGSSAALLAYAAIDAGSADRNGGFTLDLASDAEGPRSLSLHPDARILMVRTLHRDPERAPARLKLKGARTVRDLALARGAIDPALGQVAQSLLSSVRIFLEWSAVASAAPNSFLAEEPCLAQPLKGDPDTLYHLGYYCLAKGEWLEVMIPNDIPGYWSVHAYNHWCESLPGAGIGNNDCVYEPDGRVRIAVGPEGFGDAPNRIDTLGRRRGVLICRVIGANKAAAPTTLVVSAINREVKM